MEQLQKVFLACFNRLKSPQQNGYEATHTDALLLVAATDFEMAPMFTLSLRMRRKIRPREGGGVGGGAIWPPETSADEKTINEIFR